MLQFLTALVCLAAAQIAESPPEPLLTVAEKTSFEATARYDDVVAFIDNFVQRFPVARKISLGASGENRDIPCLILADPPIATFKEAAKLKKLVVLAIGNIHAGEVCGKEALLMLARDIAETPNHPLLKDLVIVFAPIFNADGNERVSIDNRPGQNGPTRGMGQRHNAAGLDLNRDFVKLDSPEVRALVRFMNEWDPAVFIDTHTTNGTLHQYTITYDGPRNPAGDPRVVEFVRDQMLPDVGERLRVETGYRSFFYGNFEGDQSRWTTYPAEPRYSIQYVGLRNRIGILSEAYAYAPFRDRVLATRDFVRHCLAYAADHYDDIRKLLDDADRRTIDAGAIPRPDDVVAIDCELTPLPRKVVVDSYDPSSPGEGDGDSTPRTYLVDYDGVCTPTRSVRRPYAYLLSPDFEPIVQTLQRHGIEVELLREDVELEVEIHDVDGVEHADRPFQNRSLLTLRSTPRRVTRLYSAGTILVRTGQKLGSLAAYLLEPQSEDGLTRWDFFAERLAPGQAHPVARLLDPVPLTRCTVRPLKDEPTVRKRPTFDALFGSGDRPDFDGSPVRIVAWLSDGEHYLQIKDDRLWIVDAATGRASPFHDPDRLAAALRSLPTIDRKSADGFAHGTSFQMTDDRSAALFNHDNDLYYARFDGSLAVRLTQTPETEELAAFSPDGRFVAFIRNNDLHAVDIQTRTDRQLTTGGADLTRNGKMDWVYYEELYNRDWRAFWWAPDSAHIAFLRLDDTQLKSHAVIDDSARDQQVASERYPKPGEPNPRVALGIVSIGGGNARWVDLDLYSIDDCLLPRVGWLPDGDTLYFYVQNRSQTWLDVNTADLRGKTRTRWRETTDAWVGDPGEPRFLNDGTWLLPSERSGRRHLERVNSENGERTAVTSGEWDVRRVHHLDADGGWVYFTGTHDSPIAENLYRVSLLAPNANGGTSPAPARLTSDSGNHSVNVGPTGAYFVDTCSDRFTPSSVKLRTGDGRLVRMLDTNPVYDLEDYDLARDELFQITARDGYSLEAILTRPHDFDSASRYPVWIMTYAGPESPTVRDAWGRGRAMDYAISDAGVLILRVDPRSASGKGAASAWTAYKTLGKQELADLTDAVEWLKRQPYVDPKRIGVSGHSYGGFMTAYAMTHSDLFAAGIAGAPVTDWRLYDSIYTERYMDTPQNNPDGYAASSVVDAAKNLHGRLLILHGAMDDNVHLQNTMQFVHALQEADKPFDLMIYPRSRHGIRGDHYNRLQYDFITRTMGVASAVDAAAPTQDDSANSAQSATTAVTD
ncbi:MAG: prolyl oligopeptidase family serine peptidase [Phycisphaerales bacterium]|nr:prolyl oligopeptidase family serine peptidase [Phycisphaerales bacterium]